MPGKLGKLLAICKLADGQLSCRRETAAGGLVAATGPPSFVDRLAKAGRLFAQQFRSAAVSHIALAILASTNGMVGRFTDAEIQEDLQAEGAAVALLYIELQPRFRAVARQPAQAPPSA